VSACEKGCRWEIGLELLGEMRRGVAKESGEVKGSKSGKHLEALEPNAVTHAALLSACAKGQQWSRSLSLLAQLRRPSTGGHPVLLDVVVFGAAISACACEGGRQWELPLQLLEEIRWRGLRPSLVACGGALSACEAALQWPWALQLLAHLRRLGLQPNLVTCSSALGACRGGDRWGRALWLVEELRIAGQSLNAVACTAAIATLDGAGASRDGGPCGWQLALQLLAQTAAASRRQRVGASSQGGEDGESGGDGGGGSSGGSSSSTRGLDALAFGAALGVCALPVPHFAPSAWAVALQLLGEARVRGEGLFASSAAATASCSALVTTCGRSRQWRVALGLLDELWAGGLQPDAVALSQAAAFCPSGPQELRLLEEVQQRVLHTLAGPCHSQRMTQSELQ
ncbi:unnamed protein product, partial [Polarella glacialis]